MSKQKPIPISLTIPARFTPGQVSGNVSCINKSTARFVMSPNLYIPPDYLGYLDHISYPYSFPNVSSSGQLLTNILGNNRISINWNAGGWIDYYIPTGLYSFTDVAFQFNQIAINNGWQVNPTSLFILQGVQATQKIIMSLNPAALTGSVFPAGGVQISFANPSLANPANNDSIGPLLGFDNTTLSIPGGGSSIVQFDAQNVANFATITSYILNCSIVTDSYLNGAVGFALYSFPLGANIPNTVVSYQPTIKYLVPLRSGSYTTIDLYFTDQSNNQLDLSYFDSPININIILFPNQF